MIELKKTTGANPDFMALVSCLDAYLAEKDGRDHDFYNQFNGITEIKYAVVCYVDTKPVSCGAIKELSSDIMEVKRMFTRAENRGKGLASTVLAGLEAWAKELGAKRVVLETGKKQVEAIRLYERSHYVSIPNYGQYIGIENSVCFEKLI